MNFFSCCLTTLALFFSNVDAKVPVEGNSLVIFNATQNINWVNDLNQFFSDVNTTIVDTNIRNSFKASIDNRLKKEVFRLRDDQTDANRLGVAGFALHLEADVIAYLNTTTYQEYFIILTNDVYKVKNCNVQPISSSNQEFYFLPRMTMNESQFVYPASSGKGVSVFVLDTGINVNHPDFGGRAKFEIDFTGEGEGDENSHGTHVAGSCCSTTYGVAKQSTVYDVKVLNKEGSGSTFGIILGLAHVLKHRILNPTKAIVINMSLGGSYNPALNAAVDALSIFNVPVAVAAGNDAVNAITASPASAPSAITVGATDQDNNIAYFSNYGSVLTVFAPGVAIISTSNSGSGTQTKQGTSQATPLVAGALANTLSTHMENNNGALLSVTALRQRLIDEAETGQINNVNTGRYSGSNSPNRIAQTPCSGTVTETVSAPGAGSSVLYSTLLLTVCSTIASLF